MMNRRTILLGSLALVGCGSAPVIQPAGKSLVIPLAASGFSTYANGSDTATFPLTGAGPLSFAFPRDDTGNARASADYLFTNATYDLAALAGVGASVTATYDVTQSPGSVWQYLFDGNAGDGPTLRLMLKVPGPLADSSGTFPYLRWYSAPVMLKAGAGQSISMPLAASGWTDVFGHPGDQAFAPGTVVDMAPTTETPAQGWASALAGCAVGLVFGGGSFAGHGVGVTGADAAFGLNGLVVG